MTPPGGRRARGERFAVGVALLCLAFVVTPRAARAQIPGLAPKATAASAPAPEGATPAEPAPPPPPPSIPVPEISQRGETTAANLRAIELGLEPTPAIARIEEELPERVKRVETRAGEATKMIEQSASDRALVYLGGSIQSVRGELDVWGRELTARATELEAQIELLGRDRELWAQTREVAKASEAPPEVLKRVQETLSAIQATRDKVEKRRAQILVLQDRVTRELSLADSTLARIAEAQQEGRRSLLARDASPVWANDFGPDARREMVARIVDSGKVELARLREFAAAHAPLLVLRVLVLAAFALLFRSARSRMEALTAEEPTLAEANAVFRHPYSAALVLTFVSTVWLDSDAPPLFALSFALLFLVPGLRLLSTLIGPELRLAPWLLAGLAILDLVRDLVSVVPDLEQSVLMAQTVAVLLALGALLRTGRLAKVEITPAEARAMKPLGYGARLAVVASLLGLLATTFGYVALGRLLGRAVLISVFSVLIVYAGLRAADGVVALALRTRPLARLHMVERFRGLIEGRIARLLQQTAALLIVLLVLGGFGLLRPALALLDRIGAITVVPGESALTLAHVLVFVGTCWLATLVSRFLRFVLEEEIYPRVDVARGIDYSISSLLHYVVLALGFVIAISWVGIDLNRITVLGGAFAVGIGFGLQNIVNNFVSGLILLFERPVQVGDTVQIADVVGEVRRIGIRSSTIRTVEGAEVIVPNATLIADRVTNWTLSDRTRRFTVDVGVAYGSDPEKVTALLLGVAKKHPRVLVQPEPVAVLLGFGDSSLNFRLQAWTSQDDLQSVRSEVHAMTYEALREASLEIPFPQRDMNLRVEDAERLAAAAAAAKDGRGSDAKKA
jgi:small-conductance mechanosensitive channel